MPKTFLISLLLSILTITISINSYAWLPRYDLYNFFDDFNEKELDGRLWVFHNGNGSLKGDYYINGSCISLNAPFNGVSYIEHSYVTYWPSGVRYGAWKGSIEFSFKLNNYPENGFIQIAKMDGGFLGVLRGKIIYYDEVNNQEYTLEVSVNDGFHKFMIVYGKGGREIYWDGEFKAFVLGSDRFTYVILGHSQVGASNGGSISFDWVQSRVEF
jgi:hypothetical protein